MKKFKIGVIFAKRGLEWSMMTQLYGDLNCKIKNTAKCKSQIITSRLGKENGCLTWKKMIGNNK